jgi:hypothetical protein
MGDNSEELVHARPRYRPRCGPRREGTKGASCGLVKRRILAVRIDQNIGVERDQEPRPS